MLAPIGQLQLRDGRVGRPVAPGVVLVQGGGLIGVRPDALGDRVRLHPLVAVTDQPKQALRGDVHGERETSASAARRVRRPPNTRRAGRWRSSRRLPHVFRPLASDSSYGGRGEPVRAGEGAVFHRARAHPGRTLRFSLLSLGFARRVCYRSRDLSQPRAEPLTMSGGEDGSRGSPSGNPHGLPIPPLLKRTPSLPRPGDGVGLGDDRDERPRAKPRPGRPRRNAWNSARGWLVERPGAWVTMGSSASSSSFDWPSTDPQTSRRPRRTRRACPS